MPHRRRRTCLASLKLEQAQRRETCVHIEQASRCVPETMETSYTHDLSLWPWLSQTVLQCAFTRRRFTGARTHLCNCMRHLVLSFDPTLACGRHFGGGAQAFDDTGVVMASMDAPVPQWNRGYQLLRLMGWKENTGLGKDGGGIVDPVRIREQARRRGR
eukprot:4322927-Pleurochrysis_carterae.AAC.1